MAYYRRLRWVILALLIATTFFLASFNATLRYIVDQRRELHDKNRVGNSHNNNKVKERDANKKKVYTYDEIDKESFGGVKQPDGTYEFGTQTAEAARKANAAAQNAQDNEELAQAIHTAEQLKKKERLNPTLNKYHTTIRPIANMELPSLVSYNRQSNLHATPDTNDIVLAADVHYGKFIRMTSSNFDQLINGGNALPHPVHTGMYINQEIENGKNGEGRGDAFVKVDNSKLKRYKKKRSRRQMKRGGKIISIKGGEEDPHTILEYIYNWYMKYMYNWYVTTLDYLYEVLGVEFDEQQVISTEGGTADGSAEGGAAATHYDDEDQFSWSDTKVGSQLIWIYGKLISLWSRQQKVTSSSPPTTTSSPESESSDTTTSSSTTSILSKQDMMAREGLFHLEKAAELGHAEAQRVVANSLASGILPISDHSLMHRLAEWEYINQDEDGSGNTKNWTSILLQSEVQVPDDFSSGGEQLSRAILLWHLSAMDGNVESAMALGYRHVFSATGGSTRLSDLVDDKMMAAGYHPLHGGTIGQGGGSAATGSSSHYGVLGTCQTALAYYEAAANGVMDELESGPTKGKVVSVVLCIPLMCCLLSLYLIWHILCHTLSPNPQSF